MSPLSKRIIDFSVMLGALISILTATAYVARPHAEEFVKKTADAYVSERIGALDIKLSHVERKLEETAKALAESQAVAKAQKELATAQNEELKLLLNGIGAQLRNMNSQ